MTPFTTVTGPAVALLQDNVDTDVIIRIERLTSLAKHDLGPMPSRRCATAPTAAWTPIARSTSRARRAPVLLAGRNFGCGSSREGAVWALQGMGVRCVMAPSFGDIFFGNCFQNGVLPVCLPMADVEALALRCDDGSPLTVDLAACTVTTPHGGLCASTSSRCGGRRCSPGWTTSGSRASTTPRSGPGRRVTGWRGRGSGAPTTLEHRHP
jgi:3-isopropylmalate/(R)-2-methylmalate dehydratase small subunit